MREMSPRTVSDARELSRMLHRGQVDKAGASYYTHPLRVAHACSAAGMDDLTVQAAFLHDVIEDTSVSTYTLRGLGFEEEVVDAVWRLTRKDGLSPEAYYAWIRESPRALAVKLADITDNLNEARLARLDPDTRQRLVLKYADALEQLRV